MAKKDRPPDLEGLEEALAQLRPIEREVLFLCAREGLRIADIASRLGLPRETVERHLADALCNLDRLLDRQRQPWWRFW